MSVKYVRALRGLKKVHIQYPNCTNRITICRFCESFEDSDKMAFDRNPCLICKKSEEWQIYIDKSYAWKEYA